MLRSNRGSRRGGVGKHESSIRKLVGIYIDPDDKSRCYLFYGSNGFGDYMHAYCNKNETPNMEVSSSVDIYYGVACGASFNISLKRRAIGG